jgi:pimeloyl-ACP methyl ester carboxylesterase
MRRACLSFGAVVTAVALAGACTDSGERPGVVAYPHECSQQSVPVHASTTDPTVYHVAGSLCLSRDPLRGGQTVQLLVSGLTYDHTYWDAEYQPDRYSYVQAAIRYGYSTFNIDRLGVGRSDHPPAQMLTLSAHAHVIGQIIAGLRTGAIGGTRFTNVVGVGHSMGAGILQYEAGTATDPPTVPDYLILAGYLTATNPAVIAQIGADLYAAATDPVLAQAGLPDGYLTTRPGTRRDLFFAGGDADPAVVALDESLKQTATMAERTTVAAARNATITRAIRTPVLIVVGQHDRLGCDENTGLSCATPAAVLDRERQQFSAPACLNTYVLPGAGHAVNLHRNAPDAYAYANRWLDKNTVGALRRPDASGCPQ